MALPFWNHYKLELRALLLKPTKGPPVLWKPKIVGLQGGKPPCWGSGRSPDCLT